VLWEFPPTYAPFKEKSCCVVSITSEIVSISHFAVFQSIRADIFLKVFDFVSRIFIFGSNIPGSGYVMLQDNERKFYIGGIIPLIFPINTRRNENAGNINLSGWHFRRLPANACSPSFQDRLLPMRGSRPLEKIHAGRNAAGTFFPSRHGTDL
jgi:hypothetical protein